MAQAPMSTNPLLVTKFAKIKACRYMFTLPNTRNISPRAKDINTTWITKNIYRKIRTIKFIKVTQKDGHVVFSLRYDIQILNSNFFTFHALEVHESLTLSVHGSYGGVDQLKFYISIFCVQVHIQHCSSDERPMLPLIGCQNVLGLMCVPPNNSPKAPKE